MSRTLEIDIRGFSFEEFVAYIFDRPVVDKRLKQDPWYWHEEVLFDPSTVCDNYFRLLRQPAFLLERFSRAQLDQAFWAIQSPNLACSVYFLIWERDLPFFSREMLARTMFDLYRGFFAIEALDQSSAMWWDSLCYDWQCGNRRRERGGEDLSMQNVMFETLSKIFDLDSQTCHGAALHGLGHLQHPHTEELINDYLKKHPSLTKERRDYALAAARFQVM